MTTLAWALSFIFMCLLLGASAVACVGISEHGKTKRALEQEATKRTGMDNAWKLEQAKMVYKEIGPGLPAVGMDLK